MRYYCTYFDKNYLALGLALYRSLEKNAGDFTLFVLCLDDYVHQFLSAKKFPHCTLIPLGEFEKSDPALAEAKMNRRLVEYYYTCTPVLPAYIMDRHRDIDIITYLDADLFFYSDPAPIFDELGSGSILIIPHRFGETMMFMEEYGKYNVGLVSFRNDATGRKCLSTWRAQCLQWCYQRVEDGKYADQKYLDPWPSLYEGVVVLKNKGAGLGIWNIDNYTYESGGKSFFVDDDRLIFYHFHGLKMISHFIFKAGRTIPRSIIRHIYAPYIRTLQSIWMTHRTVVLLGSIKEASDAFHWKFSIIVLGPWSFEISPDKNPRTSSFLKRIHLLP
jgi:hypothetical protein